MTKKEKDELLSGATVAASKILITAFKVCDLKSHIETMVINDGEEYVLTFYPSKKTPGHLFEMQQQLIRRGIYVQLVPTVNSGWWYDLIPLTDEMKELPAFNRYYQETYEGYASNLEALDKGIFKAWAILVSRISKEGLK